MGAIIIPWPPKGSLTPEHTTRNSADGARSPKRGNKVMTQLHTTRNSSYPLSRKRRVVLVLEEKNKPSPNHKQPVALQWTTTYFFSQGLLIVGGMRMDGWKEKNPKRFFGAFGGVVYACTGERCLWVGVRLKFLKKSLMSGDSL